MPELKYGKWIQAYRGYERGQWEVVFYNDFFPLRGVCVSVSNEGHNETDPDADLGVPCLLEELPAEARGLVGSYLRQPGREVATDFWKCECAVAHFHHGGERSCAVCNVDRDVEGIAVPVVAVLKFLNGIPFRRVRTGDGCDGCIYMTNGRCRHIGAGHGDGSDGGTDCICHIWALWRGEVGA